MKAKKFLAIALTLMLVVVCFAVSAAAEGEVASVTIGDTTTQYSSLQEAMNAVKNATGNVTLNLLCDITSASDYETVLFVVKPSSVTINGNDHSIAGLTQPLFNGLASSDMTIQNLTIKDSNISGGDANGLGRGALVGYIDTGSGKLSMKNCHVVNCTIDAGDYDAAGLFGYSSSQADIDITGCSVEKCTIIGGLAGAVGGYGPYGNLTVTDTTVTGNTIKGSNGVKTGILFGYSGAISGHIYSFNATESGNTLWVKESGDYVQLTEEDIHEIARYVSGATVFTAGGSYTVDPIVSNLYTGCSGTIAATEGLVSYKLNDGTWTVGIPPVAEVNGVEYTSLEDAKSAAGTTYSLKLLNYGYTFNKGTDGEWYVNAVKKTGRMVYLTVANPENNSNTTFYVNGGTTAYTMQDLCAASENRLDNPGTVLKNGDIVLLPATAIYDGSSIVDIYGDITFVGAGKDKTIIYPTTIYGDSGYRYMRLYNRYTANIDNNEIYSYNFKNLTFDGQYQKGGALNTFVVTCYNIAIEAENVTFKNFPGSVFSVWANDTLSTNSYPTKADNVGVTIDLKNVTTEDTGRLIHYDCSPYTERDMANNLDRYAFIHLNYDKNCLFNGVAVPTYDFNENTAYGQKNCFLNEVDVRPAEAKIGNIYYKTLQDALNAAWNGGTVEVLKDITVSDWAYNLSKGASNGCKDLVLKGNGHTITVSSVTDNTIKNGGALFLGTNGIEVSDLTIILPENTTAFQVSPATGSDNTATFRNVRFSGGKYGLAVQKTNGSVLVENCTFINQTVGALYTEQNADLTLNNCLFDNVNLGLFPTETGTITVNGCYFKNVLVLEISGSGTVKAIGNDFSGMKMRTNKNPAVDLSKNYWGGSAPVYYSVDAENGVLTADAKYGSYYTTKTDADPAPAVGASFTLSNLTYTGTYVENAPHVTIPEQAAENNYVIDVTVDTNSTTDTTDDDTVVTVSFPSDNETFVAALEEAKNETKTVTNTDGSTTATTATVILIVEDDSNVTVEENKVPDGIVASFDLNLVKKTVTTVTPTIGDATTTTTFEKVDYDGGLAEVKLPFDYYDAEKLYTVYYVDDLGNREKMEATYNDGFFTFYTSHFSTYVIDQSATAADKVATKFELTLVPVAGTENSSNPQYNVVLSSAEDGKYINRFTSAELTFALAKNTNGAGNLVYFFNKAAGSPINVIDEGNNLYLVNLNGTSYSDISGSSIILGTVSFGGYGKDWSFEIVDATINTTKFGNNIDVVTTKGADLTIDTSTGTTATAPTAKINPLTIAAPKQDLAINVVFPNTISANAAEYQDMTVTISGGDLTSDIVIALGNQDGTAEVTVTNTDGSEGKYTVAFGTATAGVLADQVAYKVVLDEVLTKNVLYTVTVSGAGYRTAKYNVNMNADTNAGKTLTFWNNVMDADTVIETNGTASAKVTFLAGDIVKDEQINIYDLSAVVSYFGTVNPVSAPSDYAKYDLNRDGKIDSIDVAYVLVSWGN